MNHRSGDSSAAADGGTPTFNLAGWRVVADENRLVKGNRDIVLEPKVMDVLLCLVDAGGTTVSRGELLDRVWPDVVVTDDSLHRAISRLRRSLAADLRLESAVITVPKRGYRLDASVLGLQDGDTYSGTVLNAHRLAGRVGHLLPVLIAGSLLAAAAIGFAMIRLDNGPPREIARNTRPFTAFPGQERAASFAPDGTRAVFSWHGENADNWDLYIKPVNGWTPVRLTTDPAPDFNPAWSPDGKTVAFVRLGTEGCRIMLVPAGGGTERFLRPCLAKGDVDLSWTPDSRQLYFTDRVGSDGPIAVHVTDLSGNTVRQITFPPTDYWGDHLVAASPDGRELAFARTRALGVTDVFIASSSSGQARRLTDDRLKVHGIAWSGDGQRIYFSSNRGGVFGIWQVPRTGGAPLPVTAGDVNADSVIVSRDGTKLLYESESGSSRLQAVSLTPTGSARDLSRSSGWDWHPTISPDGNQIAFISDRSGSPELWIVDAGGTKARKLTAFGGAYTNSPAWAPDGKMLLVAAPVGGNFDIYAVDESSGDVTRLTDHPAADRAPAWSHDGKVVYFGSNRTGRWEIWALTLETGDLRQVTARGGFRARDAGNGQLLLVKRTEPGLFALTPDNPHGIETRLTDQLLPLDWSNWQIARGGVYMVIRPDGLEAALARLNPETGQVTRIRDLPDFPHYSGLGIPPDEAAAVFIRVDSVESDLMLMDLWKE